MRFFPRFAWISHNWVISFMDSWWGLNLEWSVGARFGFWIPSSLMTISDTAEKGMEEGSRVLIRKFIFNMFSSMTPYLVNSLSWPGIFNSFHMLSQSIGHHLWASFLCFHPIRLEFGLSGLVIYYLHPSTDWHPTLPGIGLDLVGLRPNILLITPLNSLLASPCPYR